MEEILVSLKYFFYKIYSLLFTNNISAPEIKLWKNLYAYLWSSSKAVVKWRISTCSEIVTMNDIAAENHFL